MESLNMNNLANSLPSSSVANAEKELMDKFKAAAMSITTLYRTSLSTSKQHYNAGYNAALKDLLVVIQQGVSAGGAGNDAEGGMTIGRVMDWIDARLDAIKAREEEEDEEERESSVKGKTVKSSTPPVATTSRDKQKSEPSPSNALPTPRSPPTVNNRQTIVPPSSPSPPPIPTRSSTRIKSRAKEQTTAVEASTSTSSNSDTNTNVSTSASPPNTPSFHFTMDPAPFPDTPLVTEVVPLAPIIGMKRRHMATLDTGPHFPSLAMDNGNMLSTGPSTSTPRRRTKSARSLALQGGHPHFHPLQGRTENLNPTQDAMDVEEEGRERKRVARR